MAEPVEAPIRRVESHVDLQSQIDDLSAALQDWRRTREYSAPTEERLTRITLQCARMVESWQQMEQRRGAGEAGVEPRGGDGGRPAPSAWTGERIHALERTIEHEWNALREGHDRPDRQLRDQAVSLAESCVTAANLTLRGFASVESRLSALEQDIQGRMAQLAHDVQSVVAELRSARPQALPGGTPAFPLESVMRIHEEMRGSNATGPAGALKPAPAPALPEWTESATALTARMESLEQAVGSSAAKTARPTRAWWYSAIALIVVLTGSAVFTVRMQRRVDARLNEAAVRVSAAERERDATTAAVRQEAARQVADARQSAAQAQVVGNVLAAPDRVRYWMAGVGASSRAYAQLLFSRSRGIVFSASRLEPAGDGKTYQLWLLTTNGPVSLGLVTPDTGGRVTLSTDILPNPLGRLTGAVVTREPGDGSPQPSEDNVLVRIE